MIFALLICYASTISYLFYYTTIKNISLTFKEKILLLLSAPIISAIVISLNLYQHFIGGLVWLEDEKGNIVGLGRIKK